ncbi:hypothetical protein F9278_36195 [Streptomyces phaeolivaceus]|uniref:Uncharacterized protein n=1 Tax=Streptomyces phaeolivaceus TaxID=2653200 RepID=A0A5P8KC55_9ACTN|nr:hypothetical protein [Streptomyces phaeolivaceus]QFR00722.1 hypothetical protein F9278_36195 [Streptomyces phaeolivaceus]
MAGNDEFTEQELAAALQLLRARRGAAARSRPPVQDEGTVFIRGEGGAVFEMTPAKMSPEMKRRLRLGYLRQVNPDGSPLEAPAQPAAPAGGGTPGPDPVPRPAKSAPKKDWVLYGVTVLGLDAEQAEGMTRQDIIDLPPDFAQHPGPTPGDDESGALTGPGRPAEDAPKSEWIAHVVSKGLLSVEDASNYTKDDLIDLVS